MAGDAPRPEPRPGAPTRGASPRRRARALRFVLAATLLAAGSPPPSLAAAGDPPASSKSAPEGAKRPAPTHAWVDRGVRRALSLEPALRADFSAALGGRPVVLRRSEVALHDVSPTLQSPVLRDESGRARALPGGVVVVLDAPLGDDDARALIARHGASASRRIADRVWLVASPAGLASLELANRLADSGAFAAAQPNWWVERALK